MALAIAIQSAQTCFSSLEYTVYDILEFLVKPPLDLLWTCCLLQHDIVEAVWWK